MRVQGLFLVGSLACLGGFVYADKDLVLDPPPQKDLTLDPPLQQERIPPADDIDNQLYQDMMNSGAQKKDNPDQVRPKQNGPSNPPLNTSLGNTVPPVKKKASQVNPAVAPPVTTDGTGASGSGASTAGSDSVSPAPAPGPQDGDAETKAKTAPAAKKAERMADQLKKSLATGAEGKMGGGGAKGAAGLKPGAPNPANPQTPQDLALASMGGFGGSFTALGLHAGKGASGEAAILRQNGEPASAEELAKLKERISREPAALMRRPDFYAVLPREKFEALKTSYRDKPELRETAFKHIEMSAADRDFVRSASCDPLSGGCNPAATKTAYRKGDLVPPENLSEIQKHIEPGGAEDDTGLVEESTATPKGAAFNGSAFDAIYAKLNGLVGSIKDTMGIASDDGKAAEPSGVAAGSAETGWGNDAGGASRTFEFSGKPNARGALSVPPALGTSSSGVARPPAAPARRARSKRPIRSIRVVAELAATLLLLAFFWNRRKPRPRFEPLPDR